MDFRYLVKRGDLAEISRKFGPSDWTLKYLNPAILLSIPALIWFFRAFFKSKFIASRWDLNWAAHFCNLVSSSKQSFLKIGIFCRTGVIFYGFIESYFFTGIHCRVSMPTPYLLLNVIDGIQGLELFSNPAIRWTRLWRRKGAVDFDICLKILLQWCLCWWCIAPRFLILVRFSPREHIWWPENEKKFRP